MLFSNLFLLFLLLARPPSSPLFPYTTLFRSSLDSLQTPTMSQVMDYVTDSSFKAIFAVISQQEAVHTESYSYILSSLVSVSEQNARFDQAKSDPVVQKRNGLILDAYEAFRQNPTPQNLFKLSVNSINLEGIYFYAGFAFFYHL